MAEFSSSTAMASKQSIDSAYTYIKLHRDGSSCFCNPEIQALAHV